MTEQPKMNSRNMTLIELFECWYEEMKTSLTPNKQFMYRFYFKEYAKERFGTCAVNEISVTDWKEFEQDLLDDGNSPDITITPVSAKQALGMFQEMFEFGVMAFGLRVPTKADILTDDCDIEVFTDEEVEKLQNAVKPFDIYQLCVMMCLFTGITNPELYGLQWGDIDTDRNILTVKRTGTVKYKNNENSSSAIITNFIETEIPKEFPLPEWIAKQFEIMKASHLEDQQLLDEPFESVNPGRYKSQYKQFLNKADVKFRNINALRHTYAVNQIRNGVDVRTLTRLLGYTNVSSTYKRYGKVIKNARAE